MRTLPLGLLVAATVPVVTIGASVAASGQAVWARPVGLTVMHDGFLRVSEDADGTIRRIACRSAR